MHFTPIDNLRRCVIASPPWVIFTLSLAVMAFGVFILACRLRNDSYAMQPNMATAHYCVVSKENSKSDSTADGKTMNSTNDTSGDIVAVPVVISIKVNFYHDVVNKSMADAGVKWIGTIHDGQLGVKGSDINASLPFELLLDSSTSHHCADETCDFVLLQACASVRGVAIEHQKAHDTLDADVGVPVCKKAKSAARKSVTKTVLINRMDAIDQDETTIFSGRWCEHDSIVSVQRRDSRGLVLIPLLHDTLTARLHLLYTSYFLFTMILVLIIYATCRKTSHTKHTVRTLESVHTNYSKLNNDRE